MYTMQAQDQVELKSVQTVYVMYMKDKYHSHILCVYYYIYFHVIVCKI